MRARARSSNPNMTTKSDNDVDAERERRKKKEEDKKKKKKFVRRVSVLCVRHALSLSDSSGHGRPHSLCTMGVLVGTHLCPDNMTHEHSVNPLLRLLLTVHVLRLSVLAYACDLRYACYRYDTSSVEYTCRRFQTTWATPCLRTPSICARAHAFTFDHSLNQLLTTMTQGFRAQCLARDTEQCELCKSISHISVGSTKTFHTFPFFQRQQDLSFAYRHNSRAGRNCDLCCGLQRRVCSHIYRFTTGIHSLHFKFQKFSIVNRMSNSTLNA